MSDFGALTGHAADFCSRRMTRILKNRNIIALLCPGGHGKNTQIAWKSSGEPGELHSATMTQKFNIVVWTLKWRETYYINLNKKVRTTACLIAHPRDSAG